MNREPNSFEPVNPPLGSDDDTQEPEASGTGSDVANPEAVKGDHDPYRLRMVRGLSSALRIASGTTELLPVRPELRRLRSIVRYWPLVFPVALLVSNIPVKILPHYVPVDRLDQAVITDVTPTGDLTYPWGSLWYFAPIVPLAGFWLLVGIVRLFRVWFAITAPSRLAAWGPVVCLLTASGFSAIILTLGTKLQPPDHVALLTISVSVLFAALPVNWVVSSLLVWRIMNGMGARLGNMVFCAVLSLAVTGTGFCLLLGADVANVAWRGNGADGPTIVEPWSSLLVGAFFALVTIFTVCGMLWYNRTFVVRVSVDTYFKALDGIVRSVIESRDTDRESHTVEIDPRTRKKLVRVMMALRFLEYGSYLQASHDQYAWEPPAEVAPGINIWTEAGFTGGIQYLVCRCQEHIVYEGGKGYYGFYFHVVYGIANQLHKMIVAAEGNPESDEIPDDLLIASKLMATEITDVFYRANFSSVIPRGALGKSDS